MVQDREIPRHLRREVNGVFVRAMDEDDRADGVGGVQPVHDKARGIRGRAVERGGDLIVTRMCAGVGVGECAIAAGGQAFVWRCWLRSRSA